GPSHFLPWKKKENFLIIFFFFFVVYFNLISSSSIFFSLCFFFFLFIPIQGNPDLSFPKSSILHSVNQSSSSPPNPKPRSLLERRLCLIIISARPRNPLNFTPSCVASDSIKERRMQQRQPYIAEHLEEILEGNRYVKGGNRYWKNIVDLPLFVSLRSSIFHSCACRIWRKPLYF
ncbi:unnamed protein product, partial [Brassica oleracea]